MPDWSYQTILRPYLFSTPAAQSRDRTLRLIGELARTRFGRGLIDLLGHMTAPSALSRHAAGIDVLSPIGLGPGLDPSAVATAAFARFGFGFLEIGPVTEEPVDGDDCVERIVEREAIMCSDAPANPGLKAVAGRLANLSVRQPVGVRLAFRPGASPAEAAEERCRMIDRLSPAAFFTLDMRESADWPIDAWRAHLARVAHATAKPLWIAITPDADFEKIREHVDAAVEAGVRAIVVGGGIVDRDTGRRIIGAPERDDVIEAVSRLRGHVGDRIAIVASGGIVEPGDAIAALDAGASLVQIDAGMVYSGPGLCKRINEAVLAIQNTPEPVAAKSLLAQSWFWLLQLGISMILGGALAAVIAATRVVLPYDEAFAGMGADGIRHVNHHLLAFMTHDRITLAGTMMSIGVLYAMLAWNGVRRDAHWAWSNIVRSAAIGFASFFLFLGFGYFDPLHALVSAILFVFFVLALRDRPTGVGVAVPDLVNDRAWKRSQWGQLLFVAIGIGLVLAGVSISGIGVTRVFIPTDLMFLHTSREAVVTANAHLLPLIAHDRAGFGGALWSDGIAVLLLSLWGFRRSAKWVWYTLLLGGLPGFAAALGVHIAIGYMHFQHLFPVYLSIAMFALGLALSREYLCEPITPKT